MVAAEVWLLDIETSPIIAMIWNLGKQYVSKEQMIEDWHIMAFTAKKLNAPVNSLIYMETRNGDDSKLLKKLWEIFNKADVVITQNGKKFDEPKIKARMMLNGLKPYKPFKHHDTFEQNKDKEFTSHSLDYLTDKFCTKYKKLKHKKYPGLSLWKECHKGNPEAWAEMRKYNNYDVLSDEELYLNTRGWSKSSAPEIFYDTEDRQCKYCGEFRLTLHSKKRTKTKLYQRLQCQSCGKIFQGKEL